MQNILNEILSNGQKLVYALFVITVFFQIIGMTPLQKEDARADKNKPIKASSLALIFARRVLLTGLVLVVFLLLSPLVYSFFKFNEVPLWLKEEYYTLALSHALLFVSGIIFVSMMKILWGRYFIPYLSKKKKAFRVKQTNEELSDIVTTSGSIKPKKFDVEKYYRNEQLFLGLDEDDRPVYVPWSDWKSWNQKYVGESQVGKGVAIGVILHQVIKKYQAIFVDPKPDKHAYAIMKRTAHEQGKKFLVLDLNKKGEFLYDPLQHGNLREKRTKLHYLAGLNDDGGSADFYKAGERSELDDIFEELLSRDEETGFYELHQKVLLTGEDYLKRTKSYLKELSYLESIPKPEERKASINLKEEIKNGTIIYVKSSIKDDLVKKVTMLLVMEIVDSLMSLYEDGERNNEKDFYHISLDEVKFLISKEVSDNLATIAGFNANMGLAFQTLGDLEGLQSTKEIAQSVKINTKFSLFYQGKEKETIDYVSYLSGTTFKEVTRMEEVTENQYGAEEWSESRKVGKEKEELINGNILLSLPSRVGALFMPNHITRLLYTYWIDVDLEQWGYKKQENNYTPNNAEDSEHKNNDTKIKKSPERKSEKESEKSDAEKGDMANDVDSWDDVLDINIEENSKGDYAKKILSKDDLI